ncbi:BTAD domain-containing putative transcriptional regulator [Kribbella sp. CA-293567]|uniref:BTAD domain-containing putative transcriptional regulator n=1 Tax=Kribbella sp. CA-293567 TaxID=3002436 RepID=UPI0022DDA890|nr:BTAD domain-containing putative transcriptional regulator [Kribbella sp. CA-293567]WBQ08420.1 BTAD domain-containing putative transcriptional regulator [Kribbella sp. CA-293567]
MNGHAALTPARIAFRVLGPLEVEGPGGTPIDVCGGKPATMLTLLLLHRNAWVSTDQLIDAVWADAEPPASAQRNLKTYVWQLRRALPDERIESRSGAYRVNVFPGELDADVAAALSDEARRLLAAGSAREATTVVQHALGLWRGCPYDGLTGDASSAVERLTELHRSLREDLADAQLALGRPADAIALLRALTDEEPLREHAWARLISTLRRTGRRHDALAAYQRARATLVRELGIEPGAELVTLHQEILNEDAPLVVVTESASPVHSDLPARSPGFVGRAVELAALRAAVEEGRTRSDGGVAVVSVDGMAGIGKTAFALEAAARFGTLDRQLYLNLRTHRGEPLDTNNALGNLLRRAGFRDVLPGQQDELAALWRAVAPKMLLVLDDVADAAQAKQLLPNASGCVVLLTSRKRLAGLDQAAAVSLRPLSEDETRGLADDEILRCCAGHPAAIRELSDRVRDRQPWTTARLLARLTDRATRARELAGTLARFDPTYRALPVPVRRLYRLLSLTPQFDIRRAARLAGADQAQVEPMIDDLLDHHLVSESSPGRFHLHPVVRDHASATLLATESEAELTAAAGRARLGGQADLELVSPKNPRVA